MTKPIRTRTHQYTATAKWLHWAVALFLLAALPVAIRFSFLAPAERAEAIPAHASFGFIIVLLTIVRLGWRAANPPPPIPERTPAVAKTVAKTAHVLLYALVLWQGLIGIWMAASSPVGIRLFNGFDLSSLAPANAAMVDAIRPLHLLGAWLIAFTLFGHILGALWHHFKLRDDVLVRMMPFSGLWYRLTAADYARRWRFPSSTLRNWPRKLAPKGKGL